MDNSNLDIPDKEQKDKDMSKYKFGIKLDNLDWLAAEVLRKIWRQPP